MVMPASGKISIGNARTELGAAAELNLGSAAVRSLFSVANGVIKLSDGYGKSAALSNRGYMGGGTTGNDVLTNKINCLSFITETQVNVATLLAMARKAAAGVSSPIRGYFCGSYTKIDGLNFADQSGISLTAGLPTPRSLLAGVNSLTAGYLGGGFYNNVTVTTNKIDRLQFDTQTPANIAAVLSTARYNISGLSSPNNGYFCAGEYSKVIDGIKFNTEASFTPSALLANRGGGSGVSAQTAGYICGSGGPALSSIAKMDFATDANSTIAATLIRYRYYSTGVQSSSSGYCCGGQDGLGISNGIERLMFSTEAVTKITAVISVPTLGMAGVQSGSS